MVHNTTMKHRRGWEGAAPKSDMTARELVLRLSFFFFSFFFTDLHQLSLIRAELGWFNRNRTVSAKSSPIDRQLKRPKRIKIDLESCWNSRNRLWMRPKHPKFIIPQFYSKYLLLLLCFLLLLSLFCESRHSNGFFKNILIVKIYKKYK